LAFHGAPRFTGEIDIFVRSDPENAGRVVQALDAFGFRFANLKESQKPDSVLKLAGPPHRVLA